MTHDLTATVKKRSRLTTVALRFKKNRMAMFGLAVLLILLAVAASADLFLDYARDAVAQNMSERLQGPGPGHWFGTDQYGRDIFARIVYGARISLSMSLLVISVSTVLGAAIGGAAAFYGGRLDNLLMRVVDVFYAVPFNLLAICIVASLGSGLVNLAIACIVGVVPGFARIFRASIMPVKEQEFIEAARACGTKNRRIFLRHVLPNAVGPIIVQATLHLAQTILAISGLSYIGLGIESPMPEWGAMLSEGKNFFRDFPHLVLIPGVAIISAAMSLNLIGDGLRDALDPKLKN
ncbi:MAG: ABC transporter permease [Oscillospiraceae bacterium]|nr:ABC transporter permease [Oscillospiraceae bacterium]